jgi:hypothetical protein
MIIRFAITFFPPDRCSRQIDLNINYYNLSGDSFPRESICLLLRFKFRYERLFELLIFCFALFLCSLCLPLITVSRFV